MAAELVEDPVLRQRYRFRREGDVLTVEVWGEPGSAVPDHIHPRSQERWEVVEGEFTFTVEREKRSAGPGERVVVEPGVRHNFEVTGPEVAFARVEVEPGLDQQGFLEDGAALNRSGRFTRNGIPKSFRAMVEAAEFIDRYEESTVLLFPPRIVQRLLFRPLARLASRRSSG
jgi:quercetin dioxygenase-like cupin family protein